MELSATGTHAPREAVETPCWWSPSGVRSLRKAEAASFNGMHSSLCYIDEIDIQETEPLSYSSTNRNVIFASLTSKPVYPRLSDGKKMRHESYHIALTNLIKGRDTD
ncbi:hypothetical protein E4U37_002601 [Claviceps purpurea]|nr:hypothetical protein E4U37_002601 [Claviceps purpurea]